MPAKRTEKKPVPMATLHQFWGKTTVSSKPNLHEDLNRHTKDAITLHDSEKQSSLISCPVVSDNGRPIGKVDLQEEEGASAPALADHKGSPSPELLPTEKPSLTARSIPETEVAVQPLLENLKVVPAGNYPLVCFDLETTGLGIDDEIVQISACCIIDGAHQQFNQYVLPAKKMAPGASKVTKLRHKRGQLYHNRKKVDTCSILQALHKFIHWLKRFPKSLLVAHNAQFDSRMLIKSCVKYNLMPFGLKKAVVGFVDTLPVAREVFPDRTSYQLEGLIKDVLGQRFKAHDAREDTNALLNLIGHKSITRDVLLKHSYTVQNAEDNYMMLAEKKRNMKSLKDLVDASVISKGMAEKVAVSGLTKADLQSAVKSRGLNGLKEVLQTDCNGKPRVTKRTDIMQQLFDHLSISDS